MATGNTVFYANQPLFNKLLDGYVSANMGAFSGSTVMQLLKLEFAFSLDGPPTAELGSQSAGGNMALHFDRVSLRIYEHSDGKRGALKNTLPVKVAVTGTLGLNGQNLGLTGLKATGSGRLDERAAKIMNQQVIPQFQAQVAKIPLPDFSKVVGLPLTFTGLNVVNNRIELFANIGNTAGSPSFPSPNPSFPAIIAGISSGVISQLASSKFPGANESVRDGHKGWAGEWEASAHAKANKPQVQISNGRGFGSIHVEAGAAAGLKLPFSDWIRPGITVGVRTPPLSLRLDKTNHGKQIIVKVYLDGKLGLDFELPGPLKPVGDAILGVFQPLVTLITNAINTGLNQITINAFSLPGQIPGTPIPANLTFQETVFKGNAVVAVIKVD